MNIFSLLGTILDGLANDTVTQINGLTNTVADIQNQIELIKNKK